MTRAQSNTSNASSTTSAPNTPFGEAKKLALKISRDPKRLDQLLRKAERKLKSLPGCKEGKWERLELMVRLVCAFRQGKFQEISKNHFHLILAAFIYLVDPHDWIPDEIEMGYLDDLIIVNAVAAVVVKDLNVFLDWESKASAKPSPRKKSKKSPARKAGRRKIAPARAKKRKLSSKKQRKRK